MMKRITALAAVAALIGGCKSLGGTPGYREPGTTAVWGTWVLRTPDSTAFVGAQNVELSLSPGTFALTAIYPNSAPVHITGSATMTGNGVLTLVPQTGTSTAATTGRSLQLTAGAPVSVLASASGNTLVFSPEHREVDPTPSSVWHRVEAARAAGIMKGSTSDSTRAP